MSRHLVEPAVGERVGDGAAAGGRALEQAADERGRALAQRRPVLRREAVVALDDVGRRLLDRLVQERRQLPITMLALSQCRACSFI